MESFNMQQKRQEGEQEGEHEGEAHLTQMYMEMVKDLIPTYEFEGEAAELVGQVGMQPELGVICRCCGEGERKKTLICDGCESSFHLKCLKLRSSHALLLDQWLCANCSALGRCPSTSSCEHTLGIGDENCTRSSSSKKHRHSHKPSALQSPHDPEDGANKIRFVFKLKSAHFKGAREMANKDVEKASDRSTDESTEEAFGSSKRPTCQMECLSFDHQQGHASPSLLSSQEVNKDLIGLDGIRKKRAKLVDILMASTRDKEDGNGLKDILMASKRGKEDVNSSKPSSSQMECLTSDHQRQQAGLDIHSCESVGEELLNASVVQKTQANRADNLAFERDTENILVSASHESTGLGLIGEYQKQIGDVCLSGTVSEDASEAKFMEEQEKERHSDDGKMVDELDIVENTTQLVMDCQMKFSVTDAYPIHSGCAGTHGRVFTEAEENRTLVRVLDDAQKQHWHKDAIELMNLEPCVCSKDSHVDNGEAVLSPKEHLQVHVRLDAARLLQVYAECRERCIIVYQIGRTMEAKVDTSQGIDNEVHGIAIERTWLLGQGFYVLLLGSKEAAIEVICRGTIPFQGGMGYAIPFVPCFSPKQELQRACPVWVTFMHLPIYFRPFLQELAESLGKVLYVPSGEALETSDSPRVCICWKISKCIPEYLFVDMEGLGSKKLNIEFDTSLLRHLSESYL